MQATLRTLSRTSNLFCHGHGRLHPIDPSRRRLHTITIPALHDLRVPAVWLRDACQCPQCVHPSTKQKLHRTSDFVNVQPVGGPAGVEVDRVNGEVRVKWESEGKEGVHESVYQSEWLETFREERKAMEKHSGTDFERVPWSAHQMRESGTLFVPYDDLVHPEGVLTAIEQLLRYGLLFVSGVPHQDTSGKGIEDLAAKFGEIRETFYGRTWDVRSVKQSRNIAYTSLELGMHMDLLYFEHPPRLQILHCLRNRVKGGQSLFLDALHAANQLRTADPHAFDVLANTPVPFQYVNDGHHLRYSHPTIELAPTYSNSASESEIAYINYSPPFQAPLPLVTPPSFYTSLRAFTHLIDDPANTFEYTLAEGDAVIFDNRRVLHARRAFEAGEEGGEGETRRWLKGCYLEADAVLDRGRVWRERVGEVR